ncbi:class I adenylate-forming enzyme family protein [Brenneria uluponensis]|uniref:class I adenylate-forming enzyme family protein n=1 Tax=Brenneria uluponensis TaxID=3057057 RepID=UPI0028E9763F|nr:class I adenylate-forming enzyme family protein [Brenneria ulupoensis]
MMQMNYQVLSQYLDVSAETRPESIAVIGNNSEISYAQLRNDALKIVTWLVEQNIQRGDRVMVWMTNSPELIRCFWAIQYIGAVYVPIHPDTRAEKLAWISDDCAASLIITDAALESELELAGEQMRRLPTLLLNGPSERPCSQLTAILASNGAPALPGKRLSQDLAAIIYTSGSTGKPKGVMLTQLNMIAASQSVASYLHLVESDRIFCAIPLSFDYGLHQVIMSALIGATLIIETSFAQPLFALHRLVKQQATVFPLVPTMLSLIVPLARRFDFSSLRLITNTAAALNPADIDKIGEIFSQAQLFSMYGLTECHRCTYLEPAMLETRKQSVGKAIPNTEMWVVDPQGRAHRRNATGELVIRGATVMLGYWNNPEKTDEKLKPGPLPGERVLYTGDICRLDEEGYLYFVSRLDDVLNVCGEKVAPREVESVLAGFYNVSQVAVIGLPHPVYGDEIVAWIEIASAATTHHQQIKEWCKTRMEAYMVPHRFYFTQHLPKNSNSKIDRLALKALSLDPPDSTISSGVKNG